MCGLIPNPQVKLLKILGIDIGLKTKMQMLYSKHLHICISAHQSLISSSFAEKKRNSVIW